MLVVSLFYGLLYLFIENWFNWFEMDLLNKNKTLSEKLQFRPSNPASQWHMLSGMIAGLLLYSLFLIPFNMNNIFHIILSCFIGGVIITLIELGMGYLLFFIIKIKRFWDYSSSKIGKIKLNFLGIIDVYHFLIWCSC